MQLCVVSHSVDDGAKHVFTVVDVVYSSTDEVIHKKST